MQLSSPNIKNFLIFYQKKLFLYFEKWNFYKKLVILQEGTFQAQKNKKNKLV